MKLLDFIPTGRENAIPGPDLARAAGFKDVRSMTQEIHRLRKGGELILSAVSYPPGYFLPESVHEVENFVRSMHGRIVEIKNAVRGAEKYLQDQ